jgi:hypothetical protein
MTASSIRSAAHDAQADEEAVAPAVRLPLDTHGFIWWSLGDRRRLSAKAKKSIEARSARVFVSAVTAYEMAYKLRTGDLPKVGPPWCGSTKTWRIAASSGFQ